MKWKAEIAICKFTLLTYIHGTESWGKSKDFSIHYRQSVAWFASTGLCVFWLTPSTWFFPWNNKFLLYLSLQKLPILEQFNDVMYENLNGRCTYSAICYELVTWFVQGFNRGKYSPVLYGLLNRLRAFYIDGWKLG